MKGLKAIIAGAGAISVASLGVFGASNASATTAVSLTDNPESASSVTITHEVPDAVLNVTASFDYKVEKCGLFPDLSEPDPITGSVVFQNAQLDVFNKATASTTVDLSNLSLVLLVLMSFASRRLGQIITRTSITIELLSTSFMLMF